MPRTGAEPIRKAALINAAIRQLAQTRSLDITVAQIARAAGMSSALAHHYFGSKDEMLLAAMRQLLRNYAASLRLGPHVQGRARVEAIVAASFGPEHFDQDVIAAWMSFYALSLKSAAAARLLRVYHRRLDSNLRVGLRPILPDPATHARNIAALIDGIYLRAALGEMGGLPQSATRQILTYLDEVTP